VLTETVLGANLLTYGTLTVELAVAILIWNRACRPWVALAGLSLHAAMGYSLRVGFFGPALAVSYLAFLPPERASALIAAVRARGRRRAPAAA
jgi:hypothetical protein